MPVSIRKATESPPDFSIVIPCYNRPDLLKRTIESVLSQTHESFEAIIVDDGSPDDLKSVVEAFNDPRLVYIRQENMGGGGARNTGFDHARADWIALLDADDTFLPNKLQIFYDRIQENPTDLIFSFAYIDRGMGKHWLKPDRAPKPGEHITEYYFSAYQRTSTSTFVVQREVARSVRFDPTLPLGQDIDFKIRLAGAGHSISMIEEPLSVYDDSGSAGRVSRNDNAQALEDWLKRTRKDFSRKGYYAYRATMLSKYTGKTQPFRTFRDLVLGVFLGGVSLKMTIRRGIRAYAPGFYNWVVQQVMIRKGKSNDGLTHKTSGDHQ